LSGLVRDANGIEVVVIAGLASEVEDDFIGVG
jgi:hypothetical protein